LDETNLRKLAVSEAQAIANYCGVVKPTPVPIPVITPIPMPVSKQKFTDLKKGEWYTEAIEKLAELGLVNGYPDGTVKPEKEITRAEVMQLIYNLYKKLI
jgi:hypothetical protein